MDVEVIQEILRAAGNRADAVLAVLNTHGIVQPVEAPSATEPTGPGPETEEAASAVETVATEAQEPAETTEP